MSAIFSWLKKVFDRVIFGKISPVLIEKITDEKSQIPPQIKQDLLASIRTNNPDRLLGILQDPNNGIPAPVRSDLTSVIEVATKSEPRQVFDCLLVGDHMVGKSAFVTRHQTGVFNQEHDTSAGVCRQLTFETTSMGPIQFRVWEGEVSCDDPIPMDCAIIMFDLTNRMSYKNVASWYTMVNGNYGNIPIVLVGSKYDVKDHTEVQSNDINFHRVVGIKCYSISSKSNYQFTKPFVELARNLTLHPNLTFKD